LSTPALPPKARRQLATLRARAMRSGAALSLAEFPVVTAATPVLEKAALACLRAEILHLDGRHEESLGVFESDIEPLLTDLAPGARVELLENKNSVLRSAWKADGAHSFYQLLDRRSLLNHPQRDYRRVVVARHAASRGKHYDALTDYWAELRHAYASDSWLYRALAHADFGHECLSLGWMALAAYHFMLAGGSDLANELASALVNCSDAGVVSAVIRSGLSSCALLTHSAHVVGTIAKIADLLPDADLSLVVDRLALWAAHPVGSSAVLSLSKSTWEAIGRFAPRLDADQAGSMISLALSHPGFTQMGHARAPMLDAINALLARVRPDYAATVAPRLVAVVTDQKCDIDYAEAINALCQSVTRADNAEVTKGIKARLYPPGQPISDAYLLQVSPVFKVDIKDRSQFNAAGLSAAATIRKQVERLRPGVEPSNIGGFGRISKPWESGQMIVHIHGGLHWVEGILANKQSLEPETVRRSSGHSPPAISSRRPSPFGSAQG
jgi:hypothetical protein